MIQDQRHKGSSQSWLPLGVAADTPENGKDAPGSASGALPSASAPTIPAPRTEMSTALTDEVAVVSAFGFDYMKILDPGIRQDMQAAAVEIVKRTAAAFIENGRDLRRIKKRVGHGHWIDWLNTLAISVSTAERWMREAAFVDSNSSRLTNFPPPLIKVLSKKSTPAAICAGVLDRFEAGEVVSVAAVQAEVRQYKETEKTASQRKRLTAAQIDRDTKRRNRLERKNQAANNEWRRAEERRRRADEQIVAFLVDQIDDLPALIDLMDESSIEHSLIAKMLREQPLDREPTAHVPPPTNDRTRPMPPRDVESNPSGHRLRAEHPPVQAVEDEQSI